MVFPRTKKILEYLLTLRTLACKIWSVGVGPLQVKGSYRVGFGGEMLSTLVKRINAEQDEASKAVLFRMLKEQCSLHLEPVLIQQHNRDEKLVGFLMDRLPSGYRIFVPKEQYSIMRVKKSATIYRVLGAVEALVDLQRQFFTSLAKIPIEVIYDDIPVSEDQGICPGDTQAEKGGDGKISVGSPSEYLVGNDSVI